MKLKICLIICFGLLFGGFKAFAVLGIPVSDPKKMIVVSQDEPEFAINLPSNEGTGYSWYLETEHSSRLAEVIGFENHSPDVQLMGAPHYQQFRFKLLEAAFKAPQVLHLSFKKVRPWEPIQALTVSNDSKRNVSAQNGHFADEESFTIVTRTEPVIVKRDSGNND